MSFGQRLRTRRKELGISQGELAKALGVSLSAVSNYETGHNAMREDVLLRLFSVLDVDPNYLYQDDFENKGPACGPEELQLLNKYRELDTGGRQALQAGLPRRDLVGVIDKVRDPAAVGLAQLHRRLAEVPGAIGGVLLLAVLQGEGAVPLIDAGAHRAAAQLQQVVEALPVPDGPAEIQLAQGAVGQHLHQIADFPVGQVKGPGALMEKNAHTVLLGGLLPAILRIGIMLPRPGGIGK